MTTVAAGPSTAQGKKSGKNALKAVAPTLIRDVGLPTLAYYLLHWNGASDWTALLAGVLVSGAMLVIEAIKARKLEVFSAFMLGIFAAGLVASLISGDARMMIVKDSFVTAVVGLAFGISALTRKPLLYFAARKSHPEPAAFDATYANTPLIRSRFKMMSAVWGVGFLIEATVRVVLAYQLPVSTMVWLSHVLMFGTIGLMVMITVKWGAKKGR
jgi:intracellular septation protein A